MRVSEHTIRRDLQASHSGVCKKVYGGAVLQLPEAGNFHSRKVKNSAEKDKIAQQCAALVKPDTCIFKVMPVRRIWPSPGPAANIRITAVTNSPEIAVELMKRSHSEVILLGGQIHPEPREAALAVVLLRRFRRCYSIRCLLAVALWTDVGLTGFDFAD